VSKALISGPWNASFRIRNRILIPWFCNVRASPQEYPLLVAQGLEGVVPWFGVGVAVTSVLMTKDEQSGTITRSNGVKPPEPSVVGRALLQSRTRHSDETQLNRRMVGRVITHL
jgi:hypothetical protein